MSRFLPFAIAVLYATFASGDVPWQATLDGIGPVRIGMTVAEAELALQRRLVSEWPEEPDNSCAYYSARPAIEGLAFMVVGGRVVRYDVHDLTVRTKSGVAVGDPVARVRGIYGRRLEVMPHFYSGPDESYLTLWSKDRKTAIRFETREGKVGTFYAGYAEQVQYVEGCL